MNLDARQGRIRPTPGLIRRIDALAGMLADGILLTHQNELIAHVQRSQCVQGSFEDLGRSLISPHGVDGDAHRRFLTHDPEGMAYSWASLTISDRLLFT